MIRTQLYLPEKEHKALRYIARVKGQSMAELVRTFISRGLEQDSATDTSGQATMRALAALKLKGGPADLSDNLDHYLYGLTDQPEKSR